MSRRGLLIAEQRAMVWDRQGGRCAYCGFPMNFGTFQMAHVIPDRDWTRAVYGSIVIDNVENKRGTCSLYCNGRVQINPDSLDAERFAQRITGEESKY